MGVFLMGGILAASTVTSYSANEKAKQAEEHRARLEGINNEIKKSQTISSAYLISDQLQQEVRRQEGTTDVIAAAQGRRSDSGSIKAVKSEKKRMLDKDITRVIKTAETTGKLLDLATISSKNAAKSTNEARDTSFVASTLSSFAPLLG